MLHNVFPKLALYPHVHAFDKNRFPWISLLQSQVALRFYPSLVFTAMVFTVYRNQRIIF